LRRHQEEMQGRQNWWTIPSAQRVNRRSLYRPKTNPEARKKRGAKSSAETAKEGHASESICSENFEITLLQTDNQLCALGSPYVSSFVSLDVCLSPISHLLMNNAVKNQEKEVTQARQRNLSAWNKQHSGRHDSSWNASSNNQTYCFTR
jgi:hypothetical protein